MTKDTIIARCEANGLRMTEQRRVIAKVLQASTDHPDVEELYARASAVDAGISIATVYRTVKLFEESGILERLEFGDGRARYEDAEREHHDHLIECRSGDRGVRVLHLHNGRVRHRIPDVPEYLILRTV